MRTPFSLLFIIAIFLSLPTARAQKTMRQKPAVKPKSGIAHTHVIPPDEYISPAELPSNMPKPPMVFRCVEQMPQFPGDLSAFLHDNLRYPDTLEKEGFEGRVVITFIVRADGSVDSPQVVRPVHPLMDAEAARLIRAMPRWIPGKVNGKPVNVRFTLPITFKLD